MAIPKSMGQTGKMEEIGVSLDCILDTRLGTIARLSQTNAKLQLDNGYRTRMQDQFEGIDMAEYEALYARRDQITLNHSFQTGMLKLLREIVSQLIGQAANRPFHDGAKVTVNYWPYKLTPMEVKAFQANIFAGLGRQCQVFMRSISPDELTPRYVKSNYSLLVIYDYDEWMSKHAVNFKKTRCQNVAMYAPALFFRKELPTVQEMEEFKSHDLHPFKAVEGAASPLIELNLLDVEYFSAIDKPAPKA